MNITAKEWLTGVSPEARQAYELGYCQGSLQAMSSEIARIQERLKTLEDKAWSDEIARVRERIQALEDKQQALSSGPPPSE
jgi:flagellar motility protein MotE (MotC chaperone)